MSARSKRGRRRQGELVHENQERWLLTYSDLITLLMALFIIMWAVSSVNEGKFNELKMSLSNAFAGGKVVTGNTSVLSGESSPFSQESRMPIAPIAPAQPRTAISAQFDKIAKSLEKQSNSSDVQNLLAIKKRLDAYVKEMGLTGRLRTSIDERGLVIRVLTDDLLFASGKAVLNTKSFPLLDKIASLIGDAHVVNTVQVAGNTDNVPISTAEFPSNWELSAARASAVLEYLLTHGISPSRLSLAAYGDQRPIASNATAKGRSLNRRVEIVVLRRALTGSAEASTS